MGLQEIYFEWMVGKVIPSIHDRRAYEHLMRALHSFNFYFSIPMDENRLRDGIDLRYRFAYEHGYSTEEVDAALTINNGCSVLEMMIALALKGDERILYDYETGGRADYIFKSMLESTELIYMAGDNFDSNHTNNRINEILNHEYDYNGRGGLFTVDNPRRDMRYVDIWYQMNWYLQQIIN